MNQRNNYLQYVALGLSIIVVAFSLYKYGSSLYRQAASLQVLSSTSTTTVTISAAQLARLQAEASDGRQLRRQLQAEAALGTSTATSGPAMKKLQASVIGRPPQSPYDTLVLDIGRMADISLGSGVWWPPGVYLGEIVDIREHTAVVELVSSDGVTHPAFVSGVPILTEGQGGDGLYAEIPQSTAVSVGTAVISDVYNMPLGIVSATEDLATTNMQALYITRFVPSTAIEHVYIQRQ